ncbi:(2Fe-2S) ferredoxin domain-containing protein [candidate division KSB1 bacterium]|nr:(2Fe-2S) ferredoxin domain-containing protein [candidate division KSB1 bacterium]RQW07151.1 MAG: (2Fe-2S) ferredoxin domain-containing protein [candidate division KSB1 bacterium]
MAQQDKTPYICHIFVCTFTRSGERKSCGDEEGIELRAVLKTAVGARGWKKWVRVSQSGCLGRCDKGPNVMIYPQGIWYSQTSLDDVEEIMHDVEKILRDRLAELHTQ